MRVIFLQLFFILLISFVSSAQRVLYTDPINNDGREMNFEIIGKVKSNILIFKDIRFKYAISVYNDSMRLLDKKPLDFIEGRTFNVDFVTYPDFFYLIYQYQKKRVVYCMAVKIDATGNALNQPVVIDTTEIGFLSDNKIYSVVASDNKQYISVFKIHQKNDKFHFATILLDNQLQKIRKSNFTLPFNQYRDVYNNFSLDNDGNFVFIKSSKAGNTDNFTNLQVVEKPLLNDTLLWHTIKLNDYYLDDVKLKVDNINKRYLLNSFYYKEKRGNVDGLFAAIWDKKDDSVIAKSYLSFDESLRAAVKKDATIRTAFNNFFIKNIVVRKDGGYILLAEDHYTQTFNNTNPWNRWNNLYSPYSNYYNYYDPFYRSMYNFNNTPDTKFVYNNIFAISLSNMAVMEWNSVIKKEQFSDDNDNYLSFINFNTGGQIHFFYNQTEHKKQMLSDYSITADGTVIRNPVLRTLDMGYEFMPQFGKQVSSRQIVIPCTYHNNLICFAKIDY